MKRIILPLTVLLLSLFVISPPAFTQYDPNYPDLQIWDNSLPYTDKFIDSSDFYLFYTGLLPNQTIEIPVKLTNRSYGGTLPLTLSFNLESPQLSSLGSDANYFKVRFTDILASTTTSWYSLYDLLAAPSTDLGFVPINQGEVKDYKVELSMDLYSPSSLQNITINDIKVRLFGTSGQYQDTININYVGFTTGSYEATPLPTPTPTLKPTPSIAVKDYVLLIPLCSPKPNQYRVWKAVNLTNNQIELNWSVPKISKLGTVSLPPKDDVFFKVDAYKNLNATKFSWNDHQITLYSLPLYCSYDFLN